MSSRRHDASEGWAVTVDGGRTGAPKPVAMAPGTSVEVSDLFFATPARLKFLKSERAEAAAITEMLRRLAMANPDIRFSLAGSDRNLLESAAAGSDGCAARLAQVLGSDFRENAVELEAEREAVRLTGHAGLPTFNRGTASHQYLFVNGRPVRDKQLFGALRGAYADFLPRDRHPVAVLFVSLPPGLVDVNVHPAKAEVRFRDPGLVRGLIVGAIREALGAGARRSSSSLAGAMRPTSQPSPHAVAEAFAASAPQGFAEAQAAFLLDGALSAPSAEPLPEHIPDYPLGVARAQFHQNYIVSQTGDGIVIVDQHAAHERIVYEKLKSEYAGKAIATQPLLVPELVDLGAAAAERLADAAGLLSQTGLVIDRFGDSTILVREFRARWVVRALPICCATLRTNWPPSTAPRRWKSASIIYWRRSPAITPSVPAACSSPKK